MTGVIDKILCYTGINEYTEDPMTTLEQLTLDLPNGETIAYYKAGSGPKNLVLIHGNFGSAIHWRLLQEKLAEDFTTYALDLRGYGDTSYNTPAQTMAEYGNDVKLFLDGLDIKTCYLSGWSLGGAVAMEFASNHPNMVEKLVLLESASVQGYHLLKRNFFGKPIPNTAALSKEEIHKEVKAVLKAIAKKNTFMIKTILNMSLFTVKKPEKEYMDDLVQAVFKQRNLVDVNHALVHFNISHRNSHAESGTGKVDNLTMPVYILQGNLDKVVKPEVAQTNAKAIGENAKVVELTGCGHFPPVEDLDQVVKAYRECLG